MKTTFVLDIQKEKYEYTSLIVTGRMGDLESNTVDVYIKNGGEPCPLTNLTVFYECVKPDDTAIRDKEGVNIIDAAKGHFTYTFPAEVFSAPGQVKRSFFSIEKDKAFRATTQDFLVISLHDALTGHIESEAYISEFDKALEMVKGHRKEIDAANKRINELTAAVTGQKYQLWKVTGDDGHAIPLDAKTDINNVIKTGLYRGNNLVNAPGGANWWYIQVCSHSDSAYSCMQVAYSLDNAGAKSLYVRKKAGNIWTNWERHVTSSDLGKWQMRTQDLLVYGLRAMVGTEDGQLHINYGGDFKKGVKIGSNLEVAGALKLAGDTNWTNLKTTGVENVPDRPLKYKKTGGLVTVMGSIRNPKNTTIFATLPEGFRPPQDVAFPVVVVTGSTTAGEFTIQKGGGLFVNGVSANATCHLIASYVV
ncbi:BppU family phage baseplate upper protein [Bacillus cereus group sp. MYBK234-1]|uniref:BppU family phage baseplate upper protein n=1 Tax=unclassified Bacillus cereus group TaxID=2750818 RepID=UPI003F791039